jgi:GMP synthase-like glutamine amidotransferase
LAIVHQNDTGPGVFAETIRERGGLLDEWALPGRAAPPADPLGYDAVLTLGGGMNVDQGDRHPWLAEERTLLRELIERRVPLLGLCLGGQLVAEAAGAAARRAAHPEIGWYELELTAQGRDDPLFGALAQRFEVFEWHSYEFPLPPGAVPLARNELCLQAFRLGEEAWGLQFHPEVTKAIVNGWIDDYRVDEDAVRLDLDWEALREESERKIAAFNRLGRNLCERWLELVAARTGSAA